MSIDEMDGNTSLSLERILEMLKMETYNNCTQSCYNFILGSVKACMHSFIIVKFIPYCISMGQHKVYIYYTSQCSLDE